MNHCVPDWNMEEDSRFFNELLPSADQRISTRPDNDLVELLWQNGHVVMQSQTYRKTTTASNEAKQTHKPEPPWKSGGPFENPNSIIQEEETASWLQYSLDDPLEKEFCSDFFYGLPSTGSSAADKLSKDVVAEGDRYVKFGGVEQSNVFPEGVFKQSNDLHIEEDNTMPPPKSQVTSLIPPNPREDGGGIVNFSHFSRAVKSDLGLSGCSGEKRPGNRIRGEVGESSSMITKVSSNCGSNLVQNRVDISSSNGVMVASDKGEKENSQMKFSHDRAQTDTHDAAVTSSSGGSGCSFGRTGNQSTSNKSHKRKGRDADESECQSEDAEYESVEAKRPAPRSASTRRSRAAEVHNLSERRRRDRINEKMKALQELIPHCNKSDKASMLDEAIEYLKSLQLQVQLMWMGSGMAPMMFPGIQHYISSMGMGHGPIPSIHGPVQFPRVPLANQSISSTATASQMPVCPSPGLNPVNFPNQMQTSHLPESYARYFGLHQMQPSPQSMSLYAYVSQLAPQNQTAVAASGSCPLNDGGAPSGNIQIGKPG